MKLYEFIREFEQVCPKSWAQPRDFTGLICGDELATVERVLVCLDLSENTLNEAFIGGFDLILCHHPPIGFGKVMPLKPMSGFTGVLYKAVQNKTAVYCAHSNLSASPDGIAAIAAKLLGIEVERFFVNQIQQSGYKLVVYVPEEELEHFRRKLLDSNIGEIGKYSKCSFAGEGEGTFLPLKGAKPHVGKVGVFEKVKEFRLEVLVHAHLLHNAIEAVRKYHPYEEPAFDVIPVANFLPNAGLGAVGKLPRSMRIAEIAEVCAERFPAECITFAGAIDKFVRTAAVFPGNCDDYIDEIASTGAEILITGEISHGNALALVGADTSIICAGTFGTKWPILNKLRDMAYNVVGKFTFDPYVKISDNEVPVFQRV